MANELSHQIPRVQCRTCTKWALPRPESRETRHENTTQRGTRHAGLPMPRRERVMAHRALPPQERAQGRRRGSHVTIVDRFTGRSWSARKSARRHVGKGIVRTVQWRKRNVIEVGLSGSGSSDLGAVVGYYIDPLGA